MEKHRICRSCCTETNGRIHVIDGVVWIVMIGVCILIMNGLPADSPAARVIMLVMIGRCVMNSGKAFQHDHRCTTCGSADTVPLETNGARLVRRQVAALYQRSDGDQPRRDRGPIAADGWSPAGDLK